MTTTSASTRLSMPVSERRDHIRGRRDAAVTLVEYGDYQCPHCGRAHVVLQRLMQQLPDEVRVVFRNFPLVAVHPRAEPAAEAAEAAGAQGRFWKMHDVLFERQDALEDEELLAYAQELGLDLGRFQVELLQHAYLPRIREDLDSGLRSGVQGTPTFFINGTRHEGAWDLRSLITAIAERIVVHQHRGDGQHEHTVQT